MHVIEARNVAEALPLGVEYLFQRGVREESRAGSVLVALTPVTTVYMRPTERVLFSAIRDANPFLHLMESLWMLVGRDDVAFLNRFVGDFGARFGEPDGRLHGAYGHRWRTAFGYDQLDVVVEKLRANPSDRQCVVQMWDAARAHDLDGRWCNDLKGHWKDRPCNTHVYLRIRSEQERGSVLDLTVCCRSNDVIWGAYGANAVHFSILQEYLAARIGVGVGRYTQMSHNFHVYAGELYKLQSKGRRLGSSDGWLGDQRYPDIKTRPLVDDPLTFDEEVVHILKLIEALYDDRPEAFKNVDFGKFKNRFLTHVAWPMCAAHNAFKRKDWGNCSLHVGMVEAEDWRTAAAEWLERRHK